MHTKFWPESLKGGGSSEELVVNWRNNIRMNLWEIGWEGVDLMHLSVDRASGELLWSRQ